MYDPFHYSKYRYIIPNVVSYVRTYVMHSHNLYTFVKCTCLNTGQGNEDIQYGGIVLSTTITNDLGLIISDDMKVSDQCGIATSNGE